MKYSTILALILIALPSSFTIASSDSVECLTTEEYYKEIEENNSEIQSATLAISSANGDKTIISNVYPLLDKIEEIEKGMSQTSTGFLQTSTYEAASSLTLSIAYLGDEVVDDKIAKVNEDMQNYTEAESDVDRLQLISQIRANLKELEEEISGYIENKNLEIQTYSTKVSELLEAFGRCYPQDYTD